MADRLTVYDVACPASTPANTPVEVGLFTGGLFIVRRVTLVIPDGHSGLTGIALAYGHQPVIPANAGAYISGNDEVFRYELGDYPAGVGWTAFTCNLDSQSHAWELRFELDNLTGPAPAVNTQPIQPNDILAAIPATIPADVTAGPDVTALPADSGDQAVTGP